MLLWPGVVAVMQQPAEPPTLDEVNNNIMYNINFAFSAKVTHVATMYCMLCAQT